jgi:CopC domain
MKFFRRTAVLILLVVAVSLPYPAAGHGFAGARFFPATLSTDDPFVNDELSLPTVSTIVPPISTSVPSERSVLCVSLTPRLTAGGYKVVWRATSADTHVTNGDFRFQVLGTQRAAVSSRAR